MAEDKKVAKQDVQAGRSGFNFIPGEFAKDMSGNSDAIECFTHQTFSRRMQEFLLNYRAFTTSMYSVSDE